MYGHYILKINKINNNIISNVFIPPIDFNSAACYLNKYLKLTAFI